MRIFLVTALLLFSFDLTAQDEPAFRTWTDANQRKVEAAMQGQEAGNVTLLLRDGAKVTVPVSTLSPADQQFLKSPGPAPSRPPGATALTDWPRTVALKDPPAVRVVLEDDEKKRFVYESDHYEFVCDSRLGANAVRAFSRVFEATWLANCQLPLDLRPQPEQDRSKFRALIFTSVTDYHAGGGVEGSAGIYIRDLGALLVPLDSLGVKMVGSRVSINYAAQDYATLIHETTHQMMNGWLDRLPTWYVEGAAEYMELAEYENGRLSFTRLDLRLKQHLARIAREGRFQMLPVAQLMNTTHGAWRRALVEGESPENYASALVLTYYFYHLDGDGKGTAMRDYLRAVEKLPLGTDSTELVKKYLLRDRSYEALGEDLQARLRRDGISIDFSRPSS